MRISRSAPMSHSDFLKEKIQTKKYTYNIVKIDVNGDSTDYRVVFFINQPGNPISQTMTFDFKVLPGNVLKFKTENNKFYYNYDQVDLEQIIDREYRQKSKFVMTEV